MVEAKNALQGLSRLSSRVIRILGQNPGPYTLSGTNTYLVSSPLNIHPSSLQPSILIDTGEGAESFIPLLEQALRGQNDTRDETSFQLQKPVSWVSDIVLTHRHEDHVGGLPSVLALLSKLRVESDSSFPAPRIHKFPDPNSDPALIDRLRSLPTGSFTSYSNFDGPTPLWPLKDGSTLRVTRRTTDHNASSDLVVSEQDQATLRVIHSPGHTADHICLFLLEEKVLLTGDHVLGQGTTVFEDLTSYLGSLRKCSQIFQDLGSSHQIGGKNENRLYPGHGPVVEEGRKLLRAYLEHRLEREHQILQLLQKSPTSLYSVPSNEKVGQQEQPNRSSDVSSVPFCQSSNDSFQLGPAWNVRQMVLQLYSNYPETLFPAAARGLLLHLLALATCDLEYGRDIRVKCLRIPSYDKHPPPTQVGSSSSPDGHYCPPPPQTDLEWLEALDLPWAQFLAPTDESQLANYRSSNQRL